MKKAVSVILILTILICTPIFASATELSAAGEYPIVANPGDASLSMLVVDHPAILDWTTNEFILWMNEQTNVNLSFEMVAEEGRKDKLSLILATGQIPDVLAGCILSDEQIIRYGMEEGMFMPLNDLIDEHTVHIKEMFEKYPDAKKNATMPDGNIYSLPQLNDCFHLYMGKRMWINQTWLDNLGLEVPTTIDEFYNVLVAFRDQDANGNGDPNDEIPLAGSYSGGAGYFENLPTWFILNAFTYANDQNQGVYLENDKVVHPYNDPAFKEGLKFLNKLYTEGLLYNATFNQDLTQLTQLAENPDANILGCAPGGYVNFATLGGERYSEYAPVLPLTGPEGYANTVCNPYVPFANGYFSISKDCPNPEIAIKWVDLCYSQTGTLNAYYGPEGVAWDKRLLWRRGQRP